MEILLVLFRINSKRGDAACFDGFDGVVLEKIDAKLFLRKW